MSMRRALAVLLLVVASGAMANVCPNKIRVQLDLAAPTSYIDAKGTITGMDVEMLQLILREAGCEIEWTFESMSIERALRQVQEGYVDVITRMSIRPERTRYAHFSEVYRQEVLGLFALKDTPLPAFSTLTEAYEKGVRLIAPGAGFFGEELHQLRDRWLASGRMTAYDSATYASRLLFTKPPRGDMILIDADVFHHFISDAETEQVINVGDWLLISPAHIMFSKKTISAELVERLNAVIREHRKLGTLAAIERRYRPALLMQSIERMQAMSAVKSVH
ncbi:transporter substrate-binding domain-containing protein [Permianibacter aggregans]|uniref:ABC-type amino acid transport substrate-binding protein n=2 Tax=Permianibacter aggregans TaxID=1510150 RepID=A0A4R6UQU6_9GAMM|nr:transporter substrate-binding domain-containing protein [Permianibacter aggregans]TDQ47635.1 ABC-type amino acid transport substrate-binding protein [Permianibacter aggregans]